MTLAFLICWAPFAWIYIVKLLGMRDIDSRTIYDMLPLLCVKLGCTVINPIVYVFEKKRVRFKNTQNLSNIFYWQYSTSKLLFNFQVFFILLRNKNMSSEYYILKVIFNFISQSKIFQYPENVWAY